MGLTLCQYGDQELDIEQLLRPITKYCTMITDARSIRYHLRKGIFSGDGRPGPCWLDSPLDIQAAQIQTDELASILAIFAVGQRPRA